MTDIRPNYGKQIGPATYSGSFSVEFESDEDADAAREHFGLTPFREHDCPECDEMGVVYLCEHGEWFCREHANEFWRSDWK